MGRTIHSKINRNLKGSRCNSLDKTSYKDIIINNNLNEYVPNTIVKKK